MIANLNMAVKHLNIIDLFVRPHNSKICICDLCLLIQWVTVFCKIKIPSVIELFNEQICVLRGLLPRQIFTNDDDRIKSLFWSIAARKIQVKSKDVSAEVFENHDHISRNVDEVVDYLEILIGILIFLRNTQFLCLINK